VLVTQGRGPANGEHALGRGVLRFDAARDCVYFEPPEEYVQAGGGDRWLPVWPYGYHAARDPIRIYDSDGALVATEGDLVTSGGGFHDVNSLEPGTATCGVAASDGAFVLGHPEP
jgi:hypothetical protein